MKALESIKLPPESIILISVVRNEIVRLPSFLNHYRALGVDIFIIIDNDSSDGSVGFLSKQKDVIYLVKEESYSAANCGHDWIEEALKHYNGHWCVVADCDEFLVLPPSISGGLCAFANILENRGETAVFSYLLDMYSSTAISENHLHTAVNPLTVCNLHDPVPERASDNVPYGIFPHAYRGGMRKRVFGIMPCLNKISFFHNLVGTRLLQGAHYIDGATISEIGCITLHFKYLHGFSDYVKSEAIRGEHFHGGAEYKAYSSKMESQPTLKIAHEDSVEFDPFFCVNALKAVTQRDSAQSQLSWEATSNDSEIDRMRYAITNADYYSLSIQTPIDLARYLLESQLESRDVSIESLLVFGGVTICDQWNQASKHFLGVETLCFDYPRLYAHDLFENRLINRNPIIVIEAVSIAYGRLNLVGLLTNELRQRWPKARILIDCSWAAPVHQFDHLELDVQCLFARINPSKDYSRTPQDWYCSWKKMPMISPLFKTSQIRHTTTPLSQVLKNQLDFSVAQSSVIASAVRASLTEWELTIVERFKLSNSITAVYWQDFENHALDQIEMHSELFFIHIDEISKKNVVIITHHNWRIETIQENLRILAYLFGQKAVFPESARRTLANLGNRHGIEAECDLSK